MTYEEFCKEYVAIIKEATAYQVSFNRHLFLGQKYADLVEAYPEYEERADYDDSIWK